MKSKERITQLERENELLRQIIKLHEAKETLESRPNGAARPLNWHETMPAVWIGDPKPELTGTAVGGMGGNVYFAT